MNRIRFREILRKRVLVLDGAMGTALYTKGLPSKSPPEIANLEKPEWVYEVHRSYVEAGADIIVTNTFGANRIKMREHGLEKELKRIIEEGVKIARKVAGRKALVSVSIGPTGTFIEPVGDLSFDEAVDVFREPAKIAMKAGADLFSIETMSDIRELKAAIIGIREVSRTVPIIAMMTFDASLKTVLGTPPEVAAIVLDAMDVDVIGVNCSLGPDGIYLALERMRPFTDKPFISQPNAGIPEVHNGVTVYPEPPHGFSSFIAKKIKIGVRIFGGCCGSGPQHIKAIRKTLNHIKIPRFKYEKKKKIYLASRTAWTSIGEGEPLRLIGERINPSRRKKFSEELERMDFTTLREEAIEQASAGADVIDVNVGVPGINEKETMRKAIWEVNLTVQNPVSVDSTNPEILEEGLKGVDGKPLLNSTPVEVNSMKRIFSLAKKYGGAVVVILMDKKGIPRDEMKRFALARKAVDYAKKMGVEEVIVDPIVLPLGAEPESAEVTLRTLKLISEKLKVPTVIGLSNLSFGMPERDWLNAAFLAMCSAHGLSAVIANPLSEVVRKTLEKINKIKGRVEERVAKEFVEDTEDPIGKVRNAIIMGDTGKIEELTEEAIMLGVSPMDVNTKGIVEGLKRVGELFEKGDIFLPQVMRSAETSKKAFAVIKKYIPTHQTVGNKKRILFATVEGDIHDIGKNIVIALLEAEGFEVIDIGKNVKAEEVLKKVRDYNPDAVALSCLMTTTLPFMKKTVKLVKEKYSGLAVAVGGAVLNEKLAKEMGAEIYAKDAVEAVKVFKEFFKEKA